MPAKTTRNKSRAPGEGAPQNNSATLLLDGQVVAYLAGKIVVHQASDDPAIPCVISLAKGTAEIRATAPITLEQIAGDVTAEVVGSRSPACVGSRVALKVPQGKVVRLTSRGYAVLLARRSKKSAVMAYAMTAQAPDENPEGQQPAEAQAAAKPTKAGPPTVAAQGKKAHPPIMAVPFAEGYPPDSTNVAVA